QRNIAQLKKDGVAFAEPISGELACKTIGTGKLGDVENIVEQALALLSEPPASAGRQKGGVRDSVGMGSASRNEQPAYAGGSDMIGERILITVGGTREAIDPVRFISNNSSGKMGFAMAEAARDRGAEVTIVYGSTTAALPAGLRLIKAESAEAMHERVMEELTDATVFIGAAAVADYRPADRADGKIKKDGRETMTLELVKTADILADVAKNRSNGQLVVGFAAETENVMAYAKSKLDKKKLDMVVANDISAAGAGFDTDTNIATVISKNGMETQLPLMSKREMADKILDEIVKLRKEVSK
ncbi:MAG: bifunctional phosphopantothenoylcysteine decarboxylase/phosphopantothenate--cysteine ligase CoaBC, partial [Acidobacteria bacterium]|nr:bifunctional phosphopantothenoylcysteine decarboxylase/phosphopantothenate--cysteine ligase CoaBC [Acidobacteriota bacterium]